MSPEGKASAAALARLLAEITEDRVALVARIDDAREADRRLAATPGDPGARALAAVALHAWYTGLETIFERVARQLDGAAPTGERWHRELLTQMSVEIPGARPAVIGAALVTDLAALLAFRHFFRHASAVTFEPERLKAELVRLLGASATTDAALDELAAFLRATMAELART